MRAAQKTTQDIKILHELVPLNSLSPERFRELSEKIVIEEVKAGHYLFRKGDRDNCAIFLLEGTVTLIDGFRKAAGEIKAGTEQSRHPISNLQPRQFAARAVCRSVIARVDAGLLDVFLTWDPSNTAEVVDISAADNSDWMTRILQSTTFARLPPSKLQALLMKFKPIEVTNGQVIIAQGSEGDHFYTIHEGRCAVTRKEDPESSEQFLAELTSGDSFGEEALVSDSKRNATITMLTDGVLMRLAKQDFVDLLKTQLVTYVDYNEATRLVEEGAVWVDVRTPDEYERGSFEDSVNIPLSTLRGEMPELVFNAKYVICCDTGSRSDSAAFVLSHKGFDVCVLDGGMNNLPASKDDVTAEFETSSGYEQVDSQIRQELELVVAELEQERYTRETVEQQLNLVRMELAESGEKLGDYYSRVSRLEEEKQLFMNRYEAQREKHTGQLQSLSEELEQEKQQSHQLRTLVRGLKNKCDALRKELGSEQEQSEAQHLLMQQQLDMVLAHTEVLADGQHAALPEAIVLQGEGKPHVSEDLLLVESLQAELAGTKEETVKLKKLMQGVADEKQQLEERLQKLAQVLSVLRDSARGFTSILSGVPGTLSGQPDPVATQEEGSDIEQ